ncbi:hypothetical protein FXO37_01906 [Capsicum annuum]|nr:hypothetical protein FXO37_01906 [Capsicum annuum]
MGQTTPTEVMIRKIATSGVQNFYPPMGLTAPSEVMIRRTAIPQREQWTISMLVEGAVNSGRLLKIISMLAEGKMDISSRQAAEDNTNASGGSSGQGEGELVLGPTCLAPCQVVLELLSPMWQNAPTEVMIRMTMTSDVQNFYQPMGQTAPSELMIRRTAIPKVFSFVYIQPQAWQAAKENINASRESSGQWQAAEDNINASGGSSEQWQAAEDNTNADGGNSGH